MARSSGLRVSGGLLTRRGRCRPRSRSVQPRMTNAGRLLRSSGFGSSRFVRHYSGNRFSSSGYSDVSFPPVPFTWPMDSARDDGVSPPPGCPIRTSSDRRVPAAPRGVSSRGHVLHRPQAPRHPPCAFDAVPSRVPQYFISTPARATRVSRPPGQDRRRRPHASQTHPGIGVPGVCPRILTWQGAGGAAGSRTPDLRRAKAALSQLSYSPAPPGPPAPAVPD